MSAADLPVTVPGVGVPSDALDSPDRVLYAPCPLAAASLPEPPEGFTHGERIGGLLDASWAAGVGALVADFRSDPDVSVEFDVPADFRAVMDQFIEARGLTVTAIDGSRFRRLVSDGHVGVPITLEPLPSEVRLSAVNTALLVDSSLRALGHPGFVALARQLDELDATGFARADLSVVDAAMDLLDTQSSVVDEAASVLADLFTSHLLYSDALDVAPVCAAAQVASQLILDGQGDPWGWLSPLADEQGAWSASVMLVSADALETALALEPAGLPSGAVDLRQLLEDAVEWSPAAALLLTLIENASAA